MTCFLPSTISLEDAVPSGHIRCFLGEMPVKPLLHYRLSCSLLTFAFTTAARCSPFFTSFEQFIHAKLSKSSLKLR